MSTNRGKIFLSYRRAVCKHQARSVFEHLDARKFDVFMDVEKIGSGEVLPIILNQIAARENFLVILSPGALKKTSSKDDWITIEFEHAKKHNRNIIPLMMDNFKFETEKQLFSTLEVPQMIIELEKYSGLNIHNDYFKDGMDRLVNEFLKDTIEAPLTPVKKEEKKVVNEMISHAKNARIDANEWWYPLGTQFKPLTEIISHKKRLATPILKNLFFGLSWEKVENATSYVLQYSSDDKFENPRTLYEDSGTLYFFPSPYDTAKSSILGINPALSQKSVFGLPNYGYYRVKAKGNSILYEDSPWSNVEKVEPQKTSPTTSYEPLFSLKKKLETPRLTNNVYSLTWTTIENATSYILQSSSDEDFSAPETAYEGDKTTFILPLFNYSYLTKYNQGISDSSLWGKNTPTHYRVMAKGNTLLYDNSAWSNVIKIES